MKKQVLFAIIMVLSTALFASVMSPYTDCADTADFYNGATFELPGGNFDEEWFRDEIRKAHDIYNINTITIYGFETLPRSVEDFIFSELESLGMKAVVRIESYDSDFVAYFAVNMPVDDPVVQRNCGGLNTRAWIDAQKEYAEIIVRLVREEAARNGWQEAPVYLSVFYGWQNDFRTPSYASAGADGYFINNYSYPSSSAIPDARLSDYDLINAERLSISMETYEKQYGEAPVVMEWGFHTLEFNNGEQPNQTAGLVMDKEAKRRALKATVAFYKENYPQVRGCLYFGYNLLKEEGNPPALLDWCLNYPLEGWVPAYMAEISGEGVVNEDGSVLLVETGSSITFTGIPETQMIAIIYSSSEDVEISLYSSGRKRCSAWLPSVQGTERIGIPVIGIEDETFMIVLEKGVNLSIDEVFFSPVLEAEWGKNAFYTEDEDASLGFAAVPYGEAQAVVFSGVRGGDGIDFRYSADEETLVTLSLDGKHASFSVMPTDGYENLSIRVPVYRNAELSIFTDSDSFRLDTLAFTGIPGNKN